MQFSSYEHVNDDTGRGSIAYVQTYGAAGFICLCSAVSLSLTRISSQIQKKSLYTHIIVFYSSALVSNVVFFVLSNCSYEYLKNWTSTIYCNVFISFLDKKLFNKFSIYVKDRTYLCYGRGSTFIFNSMGSGLSDVGAAGAYLFWTEVTSYVLYILV